MAPSEKPTAKSRTPEVSGSELTQAYRDLARGEQAATALEANLSNLESKLDAMLAAFEDQPPAAKGGKQDNGPEKGAEVKQDEKANDNLK